MTTNQDQDRAEFEAYLRTEGYGGYTIKLFRSGNMPPDIRERWEGWQAARRAPSVAPAVPEGFVLMPKVPHAVALDAALKFDVFHNLRPHGRDLARIICMEFVKATPQNLAPSTPAVAEVPVAEVDDSEDGMFARILPDVSVKVGDKLYAAPAGSAQAGKEDLPIPHTYGGFSAVFYYANKRQPTGQEAFDAGMRSGRDIWGSKAAADGAGELPPLDDSFLDYHLNLILIASGSALRHYSMHKTKEDMRIALRETIKAAWRMK